MKKPTTTNAIISPVPNAPRVIFVHHDYTRLNQDQLHAILSGADKNDPRLLAVTQLIDEDLAAAMLDVSSPNINPDTRAHHSGRVDALSTLKYKLHDLRA